MIPEPLHRPEDGWVGKLVAFCLQNRLVVVLLTLFVIGWGLVTAPFAWNLGGLPRTPVAVDAIPDIGENQQIVFADWEGRSPQDIEDQITYPLSSALLGIPGVKSIRSYSMFGFASVYVIFDEKIEFYWSRTRILEKLNALPPGTLPEGVTPMLGPDATPLGQVYWYTLEGRDAQGNPTGGWGPQELRSIQDWMVRYELLAVPGVAEVASIGGHVKEYQAEVDPDAMRAHGVMLEDVARALKQSNLDTGARTMEINRVEYVIRGLGFVKSVKDLENAVVKETDYVPVRVKDVARVGLGPALRLGALDKGGTEACGGVVVVRYGANPLEVIQSVKDKIAAFAGSLPAKAVDDGRGGTVNSRVTIVPFYDRTGLIHETLGTLNRAIEEEVLVTIIVVVVMLMHLQSSLLISGLLPLAVLMCFIAMKQAGVDANIVSLSGIAIAIGTMVDMGIVLNENILSGFDRAPRGEPPIKTVYRATAEVGSAVMTAVLTTIVSFLPVFAMEAAEGKLFRPLAYTKTFALLASLAVALTIIPPLALSFFGRKDAARGRTRLLPPALLLVGGVFLIACGSWLPGAACLVWATLRAEGLRRGGAWLERSKTASNYLVALVVSYYLALSWMPLGLGEGVFRNVFFVLALIAGLLGAFACFQRSYATILRWCLDHKAAFLSIPLFICLLGLTVWLGFAYVVSPVTSAARLAGVDGWLQRTAPYVFLHHAFPGLGKEFMPDLDEGAFLFMPTTMPHASIGEALDVLQKQDMGLAALPEITTAVGKIGRAESPLDPAPVSMIETVINYHPEYVSDAAGVPLSFAVVPGETDLFRNREGNPVLAPDGKPYVVNFKFRRDGNGGLIADPRGVPFRLWRPALNPALNPGRDAWDGIRNPDDIWNEILRVTDLPGTTSAPKLQPIAARIVMLQSGMRAPMGIKVFGKGKATLEDLEKTSIEIEQLLKHVPQVKTEAVTADRVVGKPYLELQIDREAIQRYSVNIADVQSVIQTAIGGMTVTTTVEGRERYGVLMRYKRERRDSIEALGGIAVPGRGGVQIPLRELLVGREVQYRRGPQMIKSEDGALVNYVLFDKQPGLAEVDVVRAADAYLRDKIAQGELTLPEGVTYRFAGSYENQLRSEKRLMLVLPVALFAIFLLLYFQFRVVSTTMLVFTGIFTAWAGGFILIWLYGQPWFLDVTVLGHNLRELFQVNPINLSVAVWVGFIALFGIATDDGVVMATYLDQSFAENNPVSVREIREATLQAGQRRSRACLMTSVTTLLALLPVLTSTGRGADIMLPMAIPSFGGMVMELMSMFIVPTLYCALRERRLKSAGQDASAAA